ncbi:MAG: sigma-70 family RNA polymerase sigma factor [Planctomycetota bacterium]
MRSGRYQHTESEPSKHEFRATTPTKILTPKEEYDLVAELSHLRDSLLKLLRPLLKNPPADVVLNHFDQIVAYYAQAVEKHAPSAAVRKIETLLAKYNQVKHHLVVANLAWVTKLARAQRMTNVAEEDLFQEGVCGLLKAIDRFEAERGLRLMTYATWYIREAMQQVRARQSHMVSLSAHDQTLLGQMESARSLFQHQHRRAPSPKELGESFQRDPHTLSRLAAATAPLSLDHGSNEKPIPIAVADPNEEWERHEDMSLAVSRLLKALPSRERMIVIRRFGLDGEDPLSLEELGDDLNVSKERVRQLQRQAIRRMQERAAEENLELAPV